MSEKVIDPLKLLSQVRPEASAHDRRLFEMRLADEYADEQAEARARELSIGPPPIPDAQLVFNLATRTFGVAIRGSQMICPLPKGYEGRGMELAVIPGNRLIVIHPDKPALLIDPQTGTTRRL